MNYWPMHFISKYFKQSTAYMPLMFYKNVCAYCLWAVDMHEQCLYPGCFLFLSLIFQSRTKECASSFTLIKREYRNEILTLSLMYAYMITWVIKKETYISGSLVLCDYWYFRMWVKGSTVFLANVVDILPVLRRHSSGEFSL